MQATLLAAFTSGLTILTPAAEELRASPITDFSQQTQPTIISGLGKGYCWAHIPSPNGKITKLENFCGGGGEGAKDISCSPFSYRPYQFNLDQNPPLKSVCSGSPYEDIVAGAQWNMGARSWASFPKSGRKDYWVFHNCDGAGIQPDCLGDIKYIERFDGSNTQPGCKKGPHGRNHCTFTHPNSKTTFGQMKYWSGWYGFGNDVESGKICGAGKDLDRRWKVDVCNKIQNINNGSNPYKNVSGVKHTFSFALYPWVCEADSSMPNANFTSPSMDTYGVTSGWKCYADNEPENNQGKGWPPFIEIYFAGLFEESPGKYVLKLDKWMINNSDTPELIGKGFAIYPCNSGDNCEW